MKDKKIQRALDIYSGKHAVDEYKRKETKREQVVGFEKKKRDEMERRKQKLEKLEWEEKNAPTERKEITVQSTDHRKKRMSGRKKSIVDTMSEYFLTPKDENKSGGRLTRRSSVVDTLKDIGSFVKNKVKRNSKREANPGARDGGSSKRRKSIVESLKDMGEYVKKKSSKGKKKKVAASDTE